MNNRRVVVTGIGVITPVGQSLSEYWDSLIAGKNGIGPITAFDASAYDNRIAAEVKNFEPAKYFKNPKDARRADRFVQFGMAAAKEACADAEISADTTDPERVGVLVGSGIGGLQVLEDQHKILLAKGPARVSPFMIPMMITNICAGMIAMEFGFQGINFGIVSACATSNHSIGEGWRMIMNDEADCVLTGGTESAIVPLAVSGFAGMKATSTRNDDPAHASRPFDADRDGFIMGEGSGVLVLEEYEHAKKRGSKIYGEIIGYGATADAYHLTSPAPQGAGAARAMKLALKHSKISPEKVDYINAHGTSTPTGDIAETQAIKTVFNEHAKKLWISSTKSMVGHLLGAAGAIEMAACLKTLQTGIVHPTINLEKPDPECDLDYVPNTARKKDINVLMSNSFGFGGHNACIVARKLV